MEIDRVALSILSELFKSTFGVVLGIIGLLIILCYLSNVYINREVDTTKQRSKLLCRIFGHSNWVYVENCEMRCTRCSKALGMLGAAKRKIIKTKKWKFGKKIFKMSKV